MTAFLGVCVVALLTLSVMACSDDRGITSPARGVTRAALLQALTPELAALVGPDGRLQVAGSSSTGRREISGKQAGLLAVAVAKYNMPYLHTYWDAQHGGPIAYQRLSVCGEPLYASSAFQRLDIDAASQPAHPLQKGLGPFWLVMLCGPAGDPQVKIAVSAYSTDLGIDAHGAVVFPAIGGGDFVPAAISSGRSAEELPTAEEAVVLAANITGHRVAAMPQLIVPFFMDDNPLGARWRIRLEGQAHVRTSAGRTVEASELYVSRIRSDNRLGSRAWTADAIQPNDVSVTYMPLTFVGENINDYVRRQQAETRSIRAVRRPDIPVSFSATIAP